MDIQEDTDADEDLEKDIPGGRPLRELIDLQRVDAPNQAKAFGVKVGIVRWRMASG